MLCEKCGFEIPEGTTVCAQCGCSFAISTEAAVTEVAVDDVAATSQTNQQPAQANPYQANAYQANAYQANAYQANPYQANPYQANAYQANAYQANAYQANAYQANAYQANPYQANPNQANAYQGNAYQPNMYQQKANLSNKLEEPVTIGDWIVSLLLMSIPLVNIILMFVWAFGSDTKKSKANFFKAYLVFLAIGVGLGIVLFLLTAIVFSL